MNVSEGQVTHREDRYFGSIQAYLYAIVQNLKRLLFPLYCLLVAACLRFMHRAAQPAINQLHTCVLKKYAFCCHLMGRIGKRPFDCWGKSELRSPGKSQYLAHGGLQHRIHVP